MRIRILPDPLTESNCYIIEETGSCVVIDPNTRQAPCRFIEENGLSVDWILLTHEHCDHMLGLSDLRSAHPEARLLTGSRCNTGIQDRRLNMSLIMEVYLHFAGKPGVHYEPFVCAPADQVFDGEEHFFSWKDHRFRMVCLPGHTPGSTGIFLDQEFFFSGDYLLPGKEPALRLPGGNEADYDAVTEPFLRALPPGLLVCPGHGVPFITQNGMNVSAVPEFHF